MNGVYVARWVIPTSGPMELLYDSEWVSSEDARPLSLSLPFNFDGMPIRGEHVGFFFDNLLPDSDAIRKRVRDHFRTPTTDAFDLLEAIGRDCVGALQLLPEGASPEGTTKMSVTRLDDAGVQALLERNLSSVGPIGDDELDDFRISIAGAQEKIALTRHDGHWCRPHASTPTTHIFKMPLGLVGGRRIDMRASLENEWLCSRLLAAYGLPVAACEVQTFGAMKALVVARFDRALHSSKRYWLRLPQEDFCQVTATPSSRKYEADGGPGILEIAKVLGGSSARDEDLDLFLRAQLLFWMLAATDGHAKNFSVRILARGEYRLTPLYDVLSAWPIVGGRQNQVHPKKLKLAMALRGTSKHYRVDEIERRHFNETARRCGLGRGMEPIIADIIEKTPRVIEDVGDALPQDFPEDIFDAVTGGLQKAANKLERMAVE